MNLMGEKVIMKTELIMMHLKKFFYQLEPYSLLFLKLENFEFSCKSQTFQYFYVEIKGKHNDPLQFNPQSEGSKRQTCVNEYSTSSLAAKTFFWAQLQMRCSSSMVRFSKRWSFLQASFTKNSAKQLLPWWGRQRLKSLLAEYTFDATMILCGM